MSKWNPSEHALGHADMDATHEEFLDLVTQAQQATNEAFPAAFKALMAHTQAHFANEERLMEESGFPAFGEHREDHRRVLGDMTQLASRVEAGRIAFARAYLRDRILEWFTQHLGTMDSALAFHLKLAEKRSA
ncbi:MAG: bacteriohemerythrin [Magnetospiraceae bacterium]